MAEFTVCAKNKEAEKALSFMPLFSDSKEWAENWVENQVKSWGERSKDEFFNKPKPEFVVVPGLRTNGKGTGFQCHCRDFLN